MSAGLVVKALTPDLLDPVARLLGLLDQPRDIPVLAPLVEREILYRLLCSDQGCPVAPNRPRRQPPVAHRPCDRLDQRQFRRNLPYRDRGRYRGHEPVLLPSAFQGGHHDEPAAIPETDQVAGSPPASAVSSPGCRQHRLYRRLRQPLAIQPRIQPAFRCPRQPGTPPGSAARQAPRACPLPIRSKAAPGRTSAGRERRDGC